MNAEQGSLFPTDEQPPEVPVDTEAIGRHIAENARPIEYEDRSSEAAIDQGHGRPVQPEPAPTPAATAAEADNPTDPSKVGDKVSELRRLAGAGPTKPIPNAYKNAVPRFIKNREDVLGK
jgi:hypothetical protein